MKARSKFYGIKYPLFGLDTYPYDYTIRLNSVTVQKSENSNAFTIDNFQDNVPYIIRYLATKDDDFKFDFTCLNVSHMLTKKVKWGIDSSAKVFSFTKPNTFKARNVPIIRNKGTLIWVDSVSYPFEIPKLLVDASEILSQHLTIVYVDDIWVPYKYTSFSEKVEELVI